MKNVLIAIFALIISFPVFSENDLMARRFNEANDLYANSYFEDARKIYTGILKDGYESFELYYNLANSCYRLNEVGNSIYYYEKAKLLNPNNDDLEHNLELAKLRIENLPAVVPEMSLISFFKKIVMSVSVNIWGILSIVLFLSFLLMFYFYIKAKVSRSKKIRLIISFSLLFISIITILFTAYQYKRMNAVNVAIVISEKIQATSSPDESATVLFTMYEGYKVFIEKKTNEWCEVTLTDGKKAWIKKEHIRIL